jgi:hypothetical protein
LNLWADARRLSLGDARCMQSTTPTRRLILDAAIERSVIRGTLIGPAGERRESRGWLELNTAPEGTLDPAGGAPDTAAGPPAPNRFGVSR